MKILKTPAEARNFSEYIKKEGRSLGFVPTMGALHKAHISLIDKCLSESETAVVSVFVNPRQFGPNEDYQAYPRPVDEDISICEKNGVHALYLPAEETMYPQGNLTAVKVGKITETMCGAARPGHFDGVATIVAKLLNAVVPDRVYLGQKDYQQFKVIERMIRDLDFSAIPVMCPTVRETDGLAFSSRNLYLSSKERSVAPGLYRALKSCEKVLKDGSQNPGAASAELAELIKKNIPGVLVDYAGVYDPETMSPAVDGNGALLLAAAIKLGKTRLIDNLLILT